MNSPHKKIFIIAGEASGDNIGAKLIAALKKESGNQVDIFGIGGEKMAKEGVKSLFPMKEISLIGFIEIIPHIPNILDRISQTAAEILRIKPDVVITIDSPGFNFRLAARLTGKGIKLVHFVAPSVWAYKPKRAEKVAKLYDHLLMLLPFEKPYFDKVGLKSTFVGHPFLEDDFMGGDGTKFRADNSIPENAPVLCVMPGSRKGEVERLLPIFSEAVEVLKKDYPDLFSVIIAAPDFAGVLQSEARDWPTKAVVISSAEDRKNAYAAANAAICKSGTVTLEPAMAGLPFVVAYKVNPVSAWILRRMIKVQYVSLVNLILGKQVVPELLQEDCNGQKIAASIKEILISRDDIAKYRQQVSEALSQMGLGSLPTPSEKAARAVLSL